MKECAKLADGKAAEMRAAIERMLGARFGREVHVAHVERRPFAYQTSSVIEAVEVELDDGTRLELLLKDVSRAGLQRAARQSKPAFLHCPRREINVYQQILADGPPGSAICYGFVVDEDEDRFWLLLEHVHARELYQIGERPLWQAAARWLAQMHCCWEGRVEELQKRAPLLNYDDEFYRVWLRRAAEFQSRRSKTHPGWRRLVDGYGHVIERLVALPKTFIHGEFYASNVLVEGSTHPHPTSPGGRGGGVRVCPVDWEMAAVAPGLMDVAALTAGRWSQDERTALLKAYHESLVNHGAERASLDELQRDLDLCRLHVAIQWLGWSPDWTAPAEHAHDWLADAMELAEKATP
jgi:thiamine kinase-like enzyme